jgi:Zn-dependent alcohol dehydrogenase
MNEDRICKGCLSIKCNYCNEFFNPREKCEVILNGDSSVVAEGRHSSEVCPSCLFSIMIALDQFSGDKDGWLTVVNKTQKIVDRLPED